MERIGRKISYHVITWVFFVGALLFSIFRFAPVFGRVLDAAWDVLTSISYYFLFMVELEEHVTPTLITIPEDLETVLPITLEQFEQLMKVYGEILINPDYMIKYLEVVGDILYKVSQTLLMLSFPMLCVTLVLILTYSEVETNHDEPTGALRFWQRVNKAVFRPVVFYVKKYLRFLKARPWYKWSLIGVWLYNLSGLTIALEVVAFFFYFTVDWGLEPILVTVAKILADFMVPMFFIPSPLWWVIGYFVYNHFREKIAMSKIKAAVEKVKKFLKAHPGAKFVNGKQRSKKTSLLTQLKQVSENCILRPTAEEKCLNRRKQFPYFPWQSYDAFLNKARSRHRLYAWWGVHELFLFLRWAKETEKMHTEAQQRQIYRSLRRRWGYKFEDFCFGYDLRRGEVFNDGLSLVHIYDALEAYGKQYLLWTQPTPLDVSNYPIRSDFIIEDEGNMKEFKSMLFDVDMRKSMSRSQYSHRLNWGAFRLGKQYKQYNPEYNAVEYGIRVVMEGAKERKNQLTRRVAEKDEEFPTQDNDLVETESKVHTHATTVDGFTYWDDLWDDQRASSLGSDNTDLMTKIYIRKAHDVKFYIPFFALDEVFFLLTSSIFDAIYKFIQRKKGSSTALVAFLWKLYLPIFRQYTRFYNLYSYYPLEVKISDGADDEVLADAEKIPLIALIAYKSRFRTDGLGEFYYMKMRGAAMGLNDVKQYKRLSMDLPEMEEQESYMINDFTRAFRKGRWRDPLKEWEKAQAKEKAAK